MDTRLSLLFNVSYKYQRKLQTSKRKFHQILATLDFGKSGIQVGYIRFAQRRVQQHLLVPIRIHECAETAKPWFSKELKNVSHLSYESLENFFEKNDMG